MYLNFVYKNIINIFGSATTIFQILLNKKTLISWLWSKMKTNCLFSSTWCIHTTCFRPCYWSKMKKEIDLLKWILKFYTVKPLLVNTPPKWSTCYTEHPPVPRANFAVFDPLLNDHLVILNVNAFFRSLPCKITSIIWTETHDITYSWEIFPHLIGSSDDLLGRNDETTTEREINHDF